MSSSDRNSPPLPSPSATDRRRSSFSAAGIADLFNRQNNSNNAAPSGTPAYPGSITSAAAQAQRRRLSLTTLGLSGAPNQASPFNTGRPRHESFSSNSTGIDESPFEEDGDKSAASANQPNFGRRLSFGARALRERQNTASAANGDGYNFAESMRTRAERGSISNQGMAQSPPRVHDRAKSVAVMEPPKEMPKQVQKAPDAFQERILKGDFYMD